MRDALDRLITALAEDYGAEGRPGGTQAAAALRHHRADPLAHGGCTTVLDDQIRTLCESSGQPRAQQAAAAWDALPWHHSGLADGRIPPHIATRMITCEIIGPRGAIRCETCRVGLFAQIPGVDYGLRTHVAEETFLMLAGEGEWRRDGEDWRRLGPGAFSHHPSMVPHQSRSNGSGFLAAWRWTGEIGFETYLFHA